MSHLHVVDKPKVRRVPSWLEIIGFSVLFLLASAGIEAAARWLFSNSVVDWTLGRIAWTFLYYWTWRQMGWQL